MLGVTSENDLGRVIARAWSEPDFKEKLKARPEEALAEMGVGIPEGTEIEVLENTSRKMYLALPYVPVVGLPGDAEMEAMAAPGGQALEMYTQHSPHSCCTSRNGCCG